MNKDKQFYREFLRQAEMYVRDYPNYNWHLCLYPWVERDCPYLNMFGHIVANEIGIIGRNPEYSSIRSDSQRQEVMTELISYLKDKLNQLK